ncbi:MAG TPA: MFS transporter [Pyrinomonadaceae bacterium]|nr:MFS transporter [Pyrinomonadaceae bacterium]
MLKYKSADARLPVSDAGRRARFYVLTLLAVEFMDEFVFGLREASWPLIRTDFQLSYTDIGLLISLPRMIACVIEPVIGILGDVWKRRALILGGGIFFTLALLLIAVCDGFLLLLVAFILIYPASGAFVSLSQAALMDFDPTRHERNMARWALAGSLGNVAGPLALGATLMVGAGWRDLYGALCLMSLLLVAVAWRFPFAAPFVVEEQSGREALRGGVIRAFGALKRREVLRWLVLLALADLMLDGLHGYLALYLVDLAGLSETQAGISLIVWTCVGIPGDLLLLPLLERVRGLTYLRLSALVVLVLFPAFLLAPGILAKLILLGLLGFTNAGWYSILQARLYSAMPGQSGTVMALSNVVDIIGSLIPLGIGIVAEHFGIGAAMWLLWVGPVALLIGVPRESK